MKRKIIGIVARDANHGIGKDNTLPWILPEDLAQFKEVTLGNPVIMGNNTHKSIGKVLPGRTNIVLTTNCEQYKSSPYLRVADDVTDALLIADFDIDLHGGVTWVIGGGQVYGAMKDHITHYRVTEIDVDGSCDTFMEIDLNRFKLVETGETQKSVTGLTFRVDLYEAIDYV